MLIDFTGKDLLYNSVEKKDKKAVSDMQKG